METAKEGDAVSIHYTGRLENGDIFDTNKEEDPLDFVVGSEEIIPGINEMVKGMSPGDQQEAEVEPDDAYGDWKDDLVMEMDKDQLPDHMEPMPGDHLQIKLQDGTTVPVQITEVGDEDVTIDANHPLAGKTLEFDVELVSIEKDEEE